MTDPEQEIEVRLTREEAERGEWPVDPSACWLWVGPTIRRGYGLWRRTTAHRAVWEEFELPLPADHDLHHLCPNTACVNPAHLKPVERRQHRRDHASRRQGGASRYRGVYWHKDKQRWQGEFTHDGVRRRTRRFATEEEAAEAVAVLRAALEQEEQGR